MINCTLTNSTLVFENQLHAWSEENGIDPSQKNARYEAVEAIQKCISKPNQTHLNLSKTGLTSLPEGLEKIEKLRSLCLDNNPLKSIPLGLLKLSFRCSITIDDSELGREFLKERMASFSHETEDSFSD